MVRQKLGIYKKEPFCFRLDREIIRNIDKFRGIMSRSEFINNALEKLFRVSESYLIVELKEAEARVIGLQAQLQVVRIKESYQRKIV